MLKFFRKKVVIIMLTTLFIIFGVQSVFAAGSFSAGLSSSSVTEGTSVTLTITATNCAGRFNISSSNTAVATVSSSSEFLDKNSTTITITTKSAGTASISVIPYDVADYDGNDVTGSKVLTLTVKAKQTQTPSTTPNTPTTNNTNTTTNNNTNKVTKSSNANISKLKLNVDGLTPAFSKSQTAYSLNVTEDIQAITANVTLENSKATYSIYGNKDLKVGNNVVKIVVSAENGGTKTYTINVLKADDVEKSDASLSNIIVEDVSFDFDKNILEYNLGNIKNVDGLRISATPSVEMAKVEIIGNNGLKVGDNVVVVKVTSSNGEVVQEYKLSFKMLAKDEANALVVVNPYEEANDLKEPLSNRVFDNVINLLKDNATIILLYLLAVVEFIQVVYLYTELKAVAPEKLMIKIGKNRNKEK